MILFVLVGLIQVQVFLQVLEVLEWVEWFILFEELEDLVFLRLAILNFWGYRLVCMLV